jgi:hypothetical protein
MSGDTFKQATIGRGALALIALVFVGVALVTYSRTLSVPLSSDARYLFYDNEFNRDASGLAKVWVSDYFAGAITHGIPAVSGYYRPIANTLYWIEYRLAGQNDFVYNLIEVILHSLNGFLVFLVCLRLSRNRVAALVAGLFFVMHPVHAFAAVEPAAQADVLFPLFYLGAMLAFDSALRARDLREAGWKIALTAGLYMATLLTKEMGVTLPAVLVLLAVYRHYTDGISWRRVGWTIPAWLTFGAYFVLRFGIVGVETQTVGYLEAHPTYVIVIGAIKGILIHFSRLLVPLGADYPEINPWLVNFVESPFTNPLSYVALTVVLALAVIALMYKWNPYIAFWSGFFLATYSPLMRVDSIAGSFGHNIVLTEERWIYLPSVAVAAVIGYGVAKLAAAVSRRWPGKGTVYAFAGGVAIVLLFFGRAAYVHAGRHEDPHARLRQLYLLPEEELHRMHRANKLMLYAQWVAIPMGDFEEAEARMRAAYAEVPDSPITAGALATVLNRRGKWQETIELLGPWLYVSREFLERESETNFRVGDDYNRVSTMIPIVLARAYAHLGAGRAAAGLACEAVIREFDEAEIAELLQENWALNGPAQCAAAEDPDACIPGVALPAQAGWERPYTREACAAWPETWERLATGR